MATNNSVVAVYRTHTEADAAVKELQRDGVDMHSLSIVGKGYHTDEHVVGYYDSGDRMKYWGKVGAFWGGFWGLLFGSAFFMIPGTWTNFGSGASRNLDRGCFGRCSAGRWHERTGSRSIQHWNSQGQHCEVRDSTQDGSVPADCPRDGSRRGKGEGHHHQDYPS